MKTLAKITMIVLMSAGAWMLPQRASAQYPGISFQVFYDQLSPYGAWVDDPNYGYVWIPDEGPEFYPYGTGGHWVFTDYGWTWVSNFQWGWAPFHYGRWNFDSYYGWIWVPGNVWGPAWVSWRSCNGYYGWAPLAPGITIQMSFTNNYYLPDDRWMFVRDRDFDREDIDRHFVGRRENHDLIRNARVIENTRVDNSRKVTYVAGPDARDVRTATGRNIKPVPVKDNTQPGRTVIEKGAVAIYRPPVEKEEVHGQKPAPVKIIPKDNIKPVAERTKGDMVNPASKTNQQRGNDQGQPAQKTVTPKYERTDKTNPNNSNQGQSGYKQQGAPDHTAQPAQDQQSHKQQGAPDHKAQPAQEQQSQKQQGAPDHKAQPNHGQQKSAPPKTKVSEPKQNPAPAKSEKEESPRKRN